MTRAPGLIALPLAVLPLLATSFAAYADAPARAAAAPPTVVVDRPALRTLTTGVSGYFSIDDVAVGDDVRTYVLDGRQVGLYSPGSEGPAEPIREIEVPAVGGQAPVDVEVDADGFVTVLSVADNATGVRAATFHVFGPAGVLQDERTGEELGLSRPGAIAAVGGQIAVLDEDSDDIDVFDLQAAGTEPTRSLPGGSTTRLQGALEITASPDGEIAVSGSLPDGDDVRQWISVFARGASGSVAPRRYLSGARTFLGSRPTGLAIDRAGNVYTSSLYVAGSRRATGVLRFAPGTTGAAAPAALLAGARSDLGTVASVWLAPTGNLLTVTRDEAGFTGGDQVRTFRALGPYAVPSPPSRLTFVPRMGDATQRVVTWKLSRTDADTPVTRYVVRVTCGGATKVDKTVAPMPRRVVVDLGRFRAGTCVVRVSGRNILGTGAVAQKSFAVRR